MAWRPLLSWIISSSSSSSSSSSEYESDDNNDFEDSEGINDHHDDPSNVQKAQSDHIDDHEDDNDVSYEPQEAEEDQNSSSTSDYTFTLSEPCPKRRRIDHTNEALTPVQEEKKRRRKRVWSKEDEVELLRGFLEYYSTRQIRATTRKDTTSLYEEVKPKLKLECNKAKMVEKLRRLKKKYHNVVNKMNDMNPAGIGKEFRFKNPHDKVIFELSHKIWSSNVQEISNVVADSHEEYVPNKYLNIYKNNFKAMRREDQDNVGSSSIAADQETMRKTWSHSRLTTYDENNNKPHQDGLNDDNGTTSSLNTNNVDDNMKNDIPGLITGLAMNPVPLSLSKFGCGVEVVDEKWRKQQILELEAYSKRLDLVQHQVKAALEDLRSKGAE